MSFDDEDEEEIEDEGGQEDPPAKPAARRQEPRYEPRVDENAIANSVIARLKQETGEKVEKDELLDSIRDLKNRGYTDADITLTLVSTTALEKKLTRQFDKKLREATGQTMAHSAEGAAMDAIDSALGEAIKAVPKLKRIETSIKEEVANRYFADPRRKADFEQQHKVHRRAIQDLVDEVSDEMSKEFGLVKEPGRQPAAGNSAGKAAKGGEEQERSNKEKQNIPYKDRLEEDHQRQAYNVAYSNNQKRLGMKPEDAAKDAYEYARKLPKPPREASLFK